MERYPRGEGIRLISVNAAGSSPALSTQNKITLMFQIEQFQNGVNIIICLQKNVI